MQPWYDVLVEIAVRAHVSLCCRRMSKQCAALWQVITAAVIIPVVLDVQHTNSDIGFLCNTAYGLCYTIVNVQYFLKFSCAQQCHISHHEHARDAEPKQIVCFVCCSIPKSSTQTV